MAESAQFAGQTGIQADLAQGGNSFRAEIAEVFYPHDEKPGNTTYRPNIRTKAKVSGTVFRTLARRAKTLRS
jgi:hypothetical protein